jgi:hypothetical protein
MKKKLPKTKLEIELTYQVIVLQQQVKHLKAHLEATNTALDFILNEKEKK